MNKPAQTSVVRAGFLNIEFWDLTPPLKEEETAVIIFILFLIFLIIQCNLYSNLIHVWLKNFFIFELFIDLNKPAQTLVSFRMGFLNIEFWILRVAMIFWVEFFEIWF